jgi:hypothetical protein
MMWKKEPWLVGLRNYNMKIIFNPDTFCLFYLTVTSGILLKNHDYCFSSVKCVNKSNVTYIWVTRDSGESFNFIRFRRGSMDLRVKRSTKLF